MNGQFAPKAQTTANPLTKPKRYTTTWLWKDGRWQIVADHSSTIKK